MASRVVVFRGTLEVASSVERISSFLKGPTEITSIKVGLTFLEQGLLPAGSMTWPIPGKSLEKTVQEIALYISRDDVSVSLSG